MSSFASSTTVSPSSCACSSLPGLNRIVLPDGIATSSPVRGFRPTPLFRGFTTKTPNPRSSIRSPRVNASFIEWKRASTACSAFIFGTPVLSATRLMISSLITSWGLFSGPPRAAVLGCGMQVRMIESVGKNCQGIRLPGSIHRLGGLICVIYVICGWVCLTRAQAES